ncbi:MAG: two-component system sensor histidine kinase NtrB [Calditrichia bacterium]
MTSRLNKQKQILSLLNLQPRDNDQETSPPAQADSGSPHRDSVPQQRLLNQVYHFHKSIIQNVNLGLLALDRAGEITFANKNAAKLLGCETEWLLGKRLQNFFTERAEADRFLAEALLPDNKIDDWDATFACSDGREIRVDINASPLNDHNNRFEGLILSFRDLTEIQQLKEQVTRMERLALLGELSAGIAHEIRNPLAGIKAASQVLEEQFDSGDPRRGLLERVIREVDRSNKLLNEFFRFARPSRPDMQQHSVEKLVGGVRLLLLAMMKKNAIHWQENIEAGLQIYADGGQMEQILLNLLLNAIDAMPDGGALAIEARRLTLERRQWKGGVTRSGKQPIIRIEISDSGSGIAPEHLEKIFNPFFTTRPEGTGLGLSICNRLVEEHEGTLEVSSREGEGTRFTISLPARQ